MAKILPVYVVRWFCFLFGSVPNLSFSFGWSIASSVLSRQHRLRSHEIRSALDIIEDAVEVEPNLIP
jgi:hypothetical protein